MSTFIAMTPPEGDPHGTRTVFVRDGFALLAFIFPVFWFLWHRIWLWALGFIAIAIGSNLLMEADGWLVTGLCLWLAASLFAGLEGRNLRVERLAARGWRLSNVVRADGIAEAELRHFGKSDGEPAGADEAPENADRSPSSWQSDRRQPPGLGLMEWNRSR